MSETIYIGGFSGGIDSQAAARYIVHLAKKHYEEIGFLPHTRIDEYVRSGQYAIAVENTDPCGFLIWGSGWPILRIYQTCIQYDVRRRRHGEALIRALIAKATSDGYEAISLWCAQDLDANQFWESLGFLFICSRIGGQKRGRIHNRWVLRLNKPLQPSLGLGLIGEQRDGNGSEYRRGTGLLCRSV